MSHFLPIKYFLLGTILFLVLIAITFYRFFNILDRLVHVIGILIGSSTILYVLK